MKKKQKDIGWLLAPPPPRETFIHERAMARETEEIEVVDEEGEERLESMKRKALEWKAMQTFKSIMMELMEDAMMESEWRQLSCRNIVLEVLEDAVIASRWRLCRQVMEESVLDVCWETLEVSRIFKEVRMEVWNGWEG